MASSFIIQCLQVAFSYLQNQWFSVCLTTMRRNNVSYLTYHFEYYILASTHRVGVLTRSGVKSDRCWTIVAQVGVEQLLHKATRCGARGSYIGNYVNRKTCVTTTHKQEVITSETVWTRTHVSNNNTVQDLLCKAMAHAIRTKQHMILDRK